MTTTDPDLTPDPESDREIDDVAQIDDGHGDPDAAPAPQAPSGGLEGNQWRIAEALETLRRQINALAPNRSKASDGGIGDAAHASRSSDHNPWVREGAMGVVTARDFTHDPAGACDGTALAEALRASRDPRIKYLIWNRRICAAEAIGGQQPWAWRPYTGTNGHTHHVHLSVASAKALYDSNQPWTLGASLKPGTAPSAPAPASPPSLVPPPADTAARNTAMAELNAAAKALSELTSLLQRLADLQDSADPAVGAQASQLLGRYEALARAELAAQARPAAPAAAAIDDRFDRLKADYLSLYASCQIRPEWKDQVAWHRQKLLQYRPKYEPVAAATGAPWWFVGIVHALEGSFNFATHLHNGDPLGAQTVRVPAGRPPMWNPPGDWAASAIDAITFEGYANQADWSLARALYRFEGFNGFSYYEKGVNSPYLWSFSNHYSKGKFVADRVYDPETVSKQCGAAVMLRALVAAGDVTL